MGFILKKFLGDILMPLPVILILGVVGWVMWARGRRRRWGQALAGLALLLLWGLSCAPFAARLVKPLERVYPAFPGDSVDYVVVLGSGHTSDPTLPVSSILSGPGIYRLTEGVRIAQAQPWTTLVLSGNGGADPQSEASAYREVAMALGFDSTRIHVEPRPKDTHEEAVLIAPLLRGHRFALVTSANHMPRAVTFFKDQGLDPVPAPTGYIVREGPDFDWQALFPATGALGALTTVWYEFLGRTWARVTGS